MLRFFNDLKVYPYFCFGQAVEIQNTPDVLKPNLEDYVPRTALFKFPTTCAGKPVSAVISMMAIEDV